MLESEDQKAGSWESIEIFTFEQRYSQQCLFYDFAKFACPSECFFAKLSKKHLYVLYVFTAFISFVSREEYDGVLYLTGREK